MPMSRFNDDCVIKVKNDAEDAREYDFSFIQSSTAYREAKDDGCIVVLPEDNQLLIDIDSPEAQAVYDKNIENFHLHIANVVYEDRKVSRSGNKHIYVTLDRNIDATERVLFQSFLGSDQTRELLSFIRILNEDEHPTLFIEKPQQLMLEGKEPLLLTEGIPIDNVV